MILSASRRTDIPSTYSEWLFNRLKAGYVLTRNPMNSSQISRITLSSEVIDCIVFWTKDPQNMMDKISSLDEMKYYYYFQFTLTPYDHRIEKYLRPKAEIEETFIKLSKTIGKERVLWRYDPIILNDFWSVDDHKEQFVRLCERLSKFTNSVTISFVDIYSKLKTDLVREITLEEIQILSEFIGKTAKVYGLIAKSCCEKVDLSTYGIGPASCIDQTTIENICGYPLDIKVDKNQRVGCNCIRSVDLGMYNSCQNGCVYCYANYSAISIKKNMQRHTPTAQMLIGELLEGEKVTQRK